MQYAQLNQDGTYSHQITTDGNVEWDATHFCPASKLTSEEAALFRVVPLLETDPPAINTIMQSVMRDGGEFVAGQWQYKWDVLALDADAVAANQAKATQALQTAIVNATQTRLDDFAKTRGYDSILSACTYAASSIPKFASEGQYAVNARDTTWATLSTLLGEVQAGTRPMPTGFADVSPLLPVLTWP